MKTFRESLEFGQRGEQIVFDRLKHANWLLYQPEPGRHLIDAFIMDQKKRIEAVEIKTMQSFGGITNGFQTFAFGLDHWNEYRQFCFDTGVSLRVYVIEHRTGNVYWNYFQLLDKVGDEHHNGKTFQFPIRHQQTKRKNETVLLPVKWFLECQNLSQHERNKIINGTNVRV